MQKKRPPLRRPSRERRRSFLGHESNTRRTPLAHRSLRLEHLEDRRLLAVSVTRTGAAPNFVVSFVDSSSTPEENKLELRFNGGGLLEFSVNDGAFSNDLDPAGGTQSASFANIQSILVAMDDGANDQLSLELLNFSLDVTVGPDIDNSLETDVSLVDTGAAGSIQCVVTGTELIRFDGDLNDDLTYSTGQGNVAVRVDNAPVTFTDQVTTSDPAPPRVEFLDIDEFEVAAVGVGVASVTFATGALSGATTYQSRLNGQDTLIIEGAEGINDNFTITNPAVGSVAVRDNTSAKTVTELGTASLVQINSLGGNDTVEVDNTTGLIEENILFNGGTDFDLLRLEGTTAVDFSQYTPGESNDAGSVIHGLGAIFQTVEFTGLEPVVDVVPAESLLVVGTNADNAINYRQGDVSPLTNGLVSVDDHETIEFSNKATLVINALAGDDTINLNNPTTPTGLVGDADPVNAGIQPIRVDGGDPTASDTLIVNAIPGTSNNFRIRPTAQGAGLVDPNFGTAPTVSYTGIEDIEAVLQFGDDDTFSLDGTAGDDFVQFFSTAEPGRATIQGAMNQGGALPNAAFTLPQITVQGNNPVGSIGIFNFFGAGGTDDFEFHGTNSNDTFDVSLLTRIALSANGQPVNSIQVNGAAEITLEGGDGDDTFNVPGPSAILGGDILHINGGNPSGSDVLNYGAVGEVTLDLGNRTIDDAGIPGSPDVTYTGIETVNLDLNGQDLNVETTADNDDVTVTVLSATAGRLEHGPAIQKLGEVQRDSVPPLVNYSDTATDADRLLVDLLGGEDTLIVVGNALAQTFTVNVPTSSVAIDDGPVASDDGLVTYANNESLQVYGLEGNDSFVVTAGAIPVFVDGGDPIGLTTPFGGDSISVTLADVFAPGPEADEGGILSGTNAPVSFDHIENIGPITGSECVIILGTNGDDDITVIARDQSYITPIPAGLDGIQDFTVSVNGGLEVLFINVPLLYIDALAGDDDIVVRTPAPNGAAWNVDVFIAGGTPAAPTGDQGDVVELETPGQNTVIYTPTGVDTATLLLDQGVIGASVEDSLITIGPFLNACPSTPEAQDGYNSSPGGAEQIIYHGLGGGDTLTMNGTPQDDNFIANPTNGGSGSHRSNLSPTFDYVGATLVTVNGGAGGFDYVTVQGTEGIDTVTTPTATSVAFTGAGTVTLGAGLDRLDLLTFGSDDNVNLDLVYAGMQKVFDVGAGNDIVDLAGTDDATIFGGIGDDTLTGTPDPDLIFGGAGNDTIIGGAGDDSQYGEDGQDTFGNPNLNSNGVADDPGNDVNFGGPGFDNFVWEPGDGFDSNNGGEDAADIFRVFGDAAGNVFELRQGGTPTHLNVLIDGVVVDNHGVEDIVVGALGGADTLTVQDIYATEVVAINLNLGAADLAPDTVTIHGRNVADEVSIVSAGAGTMDVNGLRYNVRLTSIGLADPDDFTFLANAGNDIVTTADDLSALFASSNLAASNHFTISGGAGDDVLSTYGELLGDDGNDILTGFTSATLANFSQIIDGGSGNDQIFGGTGLDALAGGPGDDTFVPGYDLLNDTVDGGTGFDTILVEGSSFNDRIDVIQDSPTLLRYNLSGVNGGTGVIPGAVSGTETDLLTSGSVEEVKVQGGAGDDQIRVTHHDSLISGNQQALSLRFTVEGGAPGASDRLTVADNGIGDVTIHRVGALPGTGSYQIGSLQPVVYYDVEFTSLITTDLVTLAPLPTNPIIGGYGTDGQGRLFVFKADPYEANNTLPNASFLGSGPTINVDPTIDPGFDAPFGAPGDEDWYRVVAQTTGELDIRVFFRQQGTLDNGRAGLPGNGNLDIAVYDLDGIITGFPTGGAIGGVGTFGTNENAVTDSDERVRIPAVAGQTYYLRVRGAPAAGPLTNANGATSSDSLAVNVYNISVINEAAPVPFDLELEDIIYEGSVVSGSSTTVFVGNAGLPAVDDFFNGKVVSFKFETSTFNLRGEEALVLDYVGATRTFTLAFPLSATPAAGDTFQVESVDTGRNNNDNILRDNTPTIFLRVADSALLNDIPDNNGNPGSPPDEVIPIPFVTSTVNNAPSPGFRVAVFRTENDTHTHVGYAQQVPGSPGNYIFTFPTAIPDGSHFISARVEMIDPASPEQAQGFGAFAQSLEIFVDTVEPPISFGEPDIEGDGLTPDSDSFVIPNPETVFDLVTSDLTPAFWGRAEADATVRLFADAYTDLNNNGVFDFTDVNGNNIFDPGIDVPSDIPPNGVFDLNTDVFIGQDTAIPLDGNQQEPNGYWEINSVVNFNDPRFFIGIGGSRLLFATAEDVAGNVNDNLEPVELEIFIDVQGPQITDVTINGVVEFLGLNNINQLVRFNSDRPDLILGTVPVTGLAPGFTLRAIDILPVPRGNVRPGMLFGVATNGASARVYAILQTGPATAVGAPFTVTAGADYGFDFNPTSGLLRIINSANENFRFDVSNGSIFTDSTLSAGDNVGAAYDRNDTDPETPTTLYVIDSTTDTLAIQGGINGIPSPNGGVITTIGSLGVNTNANVGFDIARGSNFAYAAMEVGGDSQLYRINLATGLADLSGLIGDGSTLVGLTILPEYDLFDPKPSTDGPTPPVNSLVISFRDLPLRTQQFLIEALKVDVADTPGIYRVTGDQNGIIPIVEIIVTNQPPIAGQPALATVELVFRDPGPDGLFNTPDDIGAPLPDDRFTLFVDDEIIDLAGNHLDGESNAAEPQEFPSFPTGDGIPGGDFIARFTIDSRPEVGNYSAGSAFVDINGNLFYDPQGEDDDYTNRDLIFQIGTVSDSLFSGKFEPASLMQNDNDGFDKLGAYGYDNIAKQYRFLLDFDHDGVSDQRIVSAFQVNAIAVAGNFAPSRPGDEIGLFDGTSWYLDTNGDNVLDTKIVSNMEGNPIVGDFNGDGSDDLATYDAGLNTFYFDTNRDGDVDDSETISGPVNGFTELPLAGDYNLDGIDDLVLWTPNRQGGGTPTTSEWYIVVSDRIGQTLPNTVFDQYAPTPLGNDIFAEFGDHFALPIFGNFDPPVADSSASSDDAVLTNAVNPYDVNNDGHVAPDDVLTVINQINTDQLPEANFFTMWTGPFMDVDSDNHIAPADALEIINYINSQPDVGQPEGEAAVDATIAEYTNELADGASDDLLMLLASDATKSKKRS